MEISNNYKFLSKVFLELLRNNESFRLNLKAFAPNISADIDSFHSNPNCTCRNKIEIEITNNKDKYLEFINNFLRNNAQVNLNLQEIENLYSPKRVSGEVFIISNSAEEFKAFHNKTVSERWHYKAFSVVDKGDKLAIYFL